MDQTEKLMSNLPSGESILERTAKELQELKFALDESAIVTITDPKGTIIFVNDKFCEISKYSRKELLGQDHRIINSGYHSKEFMSHLWQTIKSGKVWKGEIRNKAKDGSFYWVDTTIVPFFDGQNVPYQFVAIRHDITAHKLDQIALKESEARLRSEIDAFKRLNIASLKLWQSQELNKGLAQILEASIALMGADKGSIQIYNPQKRILEIITHRNFNAELLEFFKEVSCERDTSACAQSFRAKHRIVVEDVKIDKAFIPYREIMEKSNVRSIVSTPVISKKEDFLGILSVHFSALHRPTTEELRRLDLFVRQAAYFIDRINIDKKLEKSEKDFRKLFEMMKEGFAYCEIILDVSGKPYDFRYLAVNPSFEKLTGLKADKVVGHTFLECFPGSKSLWIQRFGKTALTGEPDNFIEWSALFNRWYKVSIFQSEPGRFALLFEDYTERKQIEEQITALPSRIIQAQEEERKFISQEIHDDFGQMLIALKFYLVNNSSHLMKQYPELQRLSDGLKEKINEIAEKARQFSHSLAPPDLNHVGLINAVKNMLSTTERDDLSIKFIHRKLKKANLKSKEIIIYRIIQEALSNVIKHSKAKNVDINLYLRKDKIFLSIKDNGIGFDLKEITKSNRSLGLVIMRERTKLIDGNLKIKTRPGAGTQISLSAPVQLINRLSKESGIE